MYQNESIRVYQIGNEFIAETKDIDEIFISYQSNKPYRWKYDNSYIDYLNGTSKKEPKLIAEDIIYFMVEDEYARLKRFADLNVKLLAYPHKKNNINYKIVRKVITYSYYKMEFNIDGKILFGYIENDEFIIYDLTKTIVERFIFNLLATHKSIYYDLFYELYCYYFLKK